MNQLLRADRECAIIVVTSSLDSPASADERNDENVLIVTSRGIADKYLSEFKRRWAQARKPDAGEIECK